MNEEITEIEAAKLLGSSYQYKHSLFWKSLTRWGIAILTVSILPYIKPDIFRWLDNYIFIFPGLASLLSLIAAWHLGAEYFRLVQIDEKYNELLGQFSPPKMPTVKRWQKVLAQPIGWVAFWVFLVGLNVLSIVNAIFLCKLAEHIDELPLPPPLPFS